MYNDNYIVIVLLHLSLTSNTGNTGENKINLQLL